MKLLNLRKIREDNLITQEELATRAGVSPGTISRIENGRPATIKVVRSIARALGVTAADLIQNKEVPA